MLPHQTHPHQTYYGYQAEHTPTAGPRIVDEDLSQLAKSVSRVYRGVTRGPDAITSVIKHAWRTPSAPPASAAAGPGAKALRSDPGIC